MKQLLTSLCCILAGWQALAQTAPLPIVCGNDLFSQIVKERYPDLNQAFNATFEQVSTKTAVGARTPLTVRVVVHVVWKEAAENLPDSVILSQIAVLNEDYNRLNADSANLREVFQPVAASADIHFELAEIVRVETDELFELDLFGSSIFANLKNTDQGGSDAWDTDAYLNIWVCNIQPTTIFGIPIAQILGLAFPPNGLDNWPADSGAPTANEDGVVLDYRTIGRNNPYTIESPTGSGNLEIKGRTAVHEVGHYLGLRHIWGDGSTLGPNDCAQSDGIDDTPFANSQSEFNCDLTKNTCSQVETFYGEDVPDLIENYMDYASESCMTMFTQGQVDLMRNVLAGPRSGLLEPISSSTTLNVSTSVQVAPNPANEQLQIKILTSTTPWRLDVWNVDGRLQHSQTGQGSHQLLVPTTAWPNGFYLLRWQNESGHTVVEKVAIQH